MNEYMEGGSLNKWLYNSAQQQEKDSIGDSQRASCIIPAFHASSIATLSQVMLFWMTRWGQSQ